MVGCKCQRRNKKQQTGNFFIAAMQLCSSNLMITYTGKRTSFLFFGRCQSPWKHSTNCASLDLDWLCRIVMCPLATWSIDPLFYLWNEKIYSLLYFYIFAIIFLEAIVINDLAFGPKNRQKFCLFGGMQDSWRVLGEFRNMFRRRNFVDLQNCVQSMFQSSAFVFR